MRAFKITLNFVTFAILLVTLNGVLGKRGCASFGHSCYGGHGKRSHQATQILPSDVIADKDISRNSNHDHETAASEQFSNIYDAIGRPENEFISLLRKLAKSNENNQELSSKYLPKFFNY